MEERADAFRRSAGTPTSQASVTSSHQFVPGSSHSGTRKVYGAGKSKESQKQNQSESSAAGVHSGVTMELTTGEMERVRGSSDHLTSASSESDKSENGVLFDRLMERDRSVVGGSYRRKVNEHGQKIPSFQREHAPIGPQPPKNEQRMQDIQQDVLRAALAAEGRSMQSSGSGIVTSFQARGLKYNSKTGSSSLNDMPMDLRRPDPLNPGLPDSSVASASSGVSTGHNASPTELNKDKLRKMSQDGVTGDRAAETKYEKEVGTFFDEEYNVPGSSDASSPQKSVQSQSQPEDAKADAEDVGASQGGSPSPKAKSDVVAEQEGGAAAAAPASNKQLGSLHFKQTKKNHHG